MNRKVLIIGMIAVILQAIVIIIVWNWVKKSADKFPDTINFNFPSEEFLQTSQHEWKSCDCGINQEFIEEIMTLQKREYLFESGYCYRIECPRCSRAYISSKNGYEQIGYFYFSYREKGLFCARAYCGSCGYPLGTDWTIWEMKKEGEE